MSQTGNNYQYSDVYARIDYCRANSNDISFHRYLDTMTDEAANARRSANDIIRDIDFNFNRYLQYMNSLSEEVKQEPVPVTSPVAQPVPVPQKNKTSLEYKIGAGVLSVIGILFILVALIYFGNNYLEDYFQGILMIVTGAVIVCASELFIQKKLPPFAQIITSIGFVVIYSSIAFCSITIEEFPIAATLALTALAAFGNIYISYIRDYPIVDIIAASGSFFTLLAVNGSGEFYLFVVNCCFMLFMNILLYLANRHTKNIVSVYLRLMFQLILFYAAFAINDGFVNFSEVSEAKLFFIIFASMEIGTALLCFCVNISNLGIKIFAAVNAVLFDFCLIYSDKTEKMLSLIVTPVAITLVFGFAFFYLLKVKNKDKWIIYAIYVLSVLFFSENNLDTAIAHLVAIAFLILSKYLLTVEDTAIADAIISGVAVCMFVLPSECPLNIVVTAVIVIGCFICTKYKLYNQLLATFGTVGLAFSWLMNYEYCVLVYMVIVFAFMLAFTLIPGMQHKMTQVYNLICMAALGFFAFLLSGYKIAGKDNFFVSLGVLTVGIAAILLCLTEKFKMQTKYKYLIFAFYLTYMIFVFEMESFGRSITLMAGAFIIIAVGCVANKFELRVYGLCLSLFDCFKVAIWDFRGKDDTERMLIYLVVGVIAILISFSYILLERNEQKRSGNS